MWNYGCWFRKQNKAQNAGVTWLPILCQTSCVYTIRVSTPGSPQSHCSSCVYILVWTRCICTLVSSVPTVLNFSWLRILLFIKWEFVSTRNVQCAFLPIQPERYTTICKLVRKMAIRFIPHDKSLTTNRRPSQCVLVVSAGVTKPG